MISKYMDQKYIYGYKLNANKIVNSKQLSPLVSCDVAIVKDTSYNN